MGRISALTELTSLASDDYLVVLDSSANIAKKITIANAFGIPDLGWTAAGESWTYASATTITVPTDATTKYDEGMLIKITQATGGTKYAVIITVAATLLTVFLLNGATLANEAITSPSYTSANPLGAGLKPSQSLTATVGFRAYHNATQNSGNGNFAAMSFNTEEYDLGGNFASDAFTAPVAGLYLFGARWHTGGAPNRVICSLYKDTGGGYNEEARGVDISVPTGAAGIGTEVIASIKLNAGDKIKAYSFASATQTIVTSQAQTYFWGFLVGRT